MVLVSADCDDARTDSARDEHREHITRPDPLPLHNVLSIGDLVLVAGAGVMFHELSRSRWSGRPAPGVDERSAERSAEREPAFAPH